MSFDTITRLYTWNPPTSAHEDLEYIERRMFMSPHCVDWEVDVIFRQRGSKPANANNALARKSTFSPSYCVSFYDCGQACVVPKRDDLHSSVCGVADDAHAERTSSGTNSQLAEMLSTCIVVTSAQEMDLAGIDVKKVSCKCVGRRYLLGDLVVSVGHFNKGQAFRPLLEVAVVDEAQAKYCSVEAVAALLRELDVFVCELLPEICVSSLRRLNMQAEARETEGETKRERGHSAATNTSGRVSWWTSIESRALQWTLITSFPIHTNTPPSAAASTSTSSSRR